MENADANQLIDKLVARYARKEHHPFPSEDCRKIRGHNDLYENLIPHLDLYFSDIAGYCSLGKEILKSSNEKIDDLRIKLSKSFFEKYPQYQPLKELITETDTPDLYKTIATYESIRLLMLNIIA